MITRKTASGLDNPKDLLPIPALVEIAAVVCNALLQVWNLIGLPAFILLKYQGLEKCIPRLLMSFG